MPTLLSRHTHHFLFPKLTKDSSRNIVFLFAIRILRELANKFSLFFLPVFLFKLGSDIGFLGHLGLSNFQGGMVLTAIYMGGTRLTTLFTALPAGKFIKKNGFKVALALSYLLYSVLLISLRMAGENPLWLILGALADGVGTFLMWSSYNSLLSNSAPKKHMGEDLGILQFLLNITWMVAPALSGLVVVVFGFDVLFMVGLVFTGLAIFSSLMLNPPPLKDEVSFKELKFWVSDRRFIKLGLSIAGKAIYDLSIFAWPLYVYLLLGSASTVGYLYSLSFFISMIMSIFIGKQMDKKPSRKPFVFSGTLMSFLWILRSQILDFWSIAIVDALDKITGNFHWLFYDSVLMRRGKGREAFSYFTYREMIVSVTVVGFWTIFALLFVVFPLEWNGLFVVASIGVLMSLLINKRYED